MDIGNGNNGGTIVAVRVDRHLNRERLELELVFLSTDGTSGPLVEHCFKMWKLL